MFLDKGSCEVFLAIFKTGVEDLEEFIRSYEPETDDWFE